MGGSFVCGMHSNVPLLEQAWGGAFKRRVDLPVVEVLERLQEFAIVRVDAFGQLMMFALSPSLYADRVAIAHGLFGWLAARSRLDVLFALFSRLI